MRAGTVLLAIQLSVVAGFGRLQNASSESCAAGSHSVCACSELAPGCGWCSSSQSCRPASECTTTCRECPHTHETCRTSCMRRCIDTCALMSSVCGCAELDGCGWCSHAAAGEQCQPYPECSTTCDECDATCANHRHCRAKCFTRFRATPDFRKEQHPALFGLRPQDLRTASATFTATVLASAAGIGGGSLLVPIFTLLGGFTEHEAIPLSKATIFGSSSVSLFVYMLWRRHPLAPRRPLIDWQLAACLIPPMLLGVTVGVYVNKMTPNWLIMLLAATMCAVAGGRTLRQARAKWAAESGARYEVVPQRPSEAARSAGGAAAGDGGDGATKAVVPTAGTGEEEEEDEEGPPEPLVPLRTLGAIVRAWLVVFSLGLLKGGHGAPSLLGLRCGSAAFYLVVLANAPILLALTLQARRALLAHAASAARARRVRGDVAWDAATVRYWCGFIALWSVGAGMVGLGGGQIIKPAFNELELLQEVSSATAALMMLFMSSTTVSQFVLFGALEPRLAAFYGAVGALGSVAGNRAARAVLERSGRPSLVVFLLGVLLLGSGGLMVAAGLPRLLETGFTAFRPLCGRVGAAERSHE